MSHTYKSDYPSDLTTDPEIVQFFEDFYKTSDTPGAHDKYVDLFTKDAQFVLASKRSVGHDGRKFRPTQMEISLSIMQKSQRQGMACGLLSPPENTRSPRSSLSEMGLMSLCSMVRLRWA